MASLNSKKDGGWGWIVVAASFFINFMMDGIRYSFGLLYIEFLNQFDESKAAVGLVGGIMFGLLLICAPISAVLVNKFGCRLITISGSCLVSLGFFCSVFANSVGFLYMTLGVLGGVGFSMLFMTMYIAIIERFERYRSIAIGLAVSGSGLGGFAFSPLTNFMIETYSWRGTLLILSSILLNGCICGSVMRPIHADRTTEAKKADKLDNQTERSVLLTTHTDTVKMEMADHDDNGDTSVTSVQTNTEEITELEIALTSHSQKTEVRCILQAQTENLCMVYTLSDKGTNELSYNAADDDSTRRIGINDNTQDKLAGQTASTPKGLCGRIKSVLSETFHFSLLMNKLFVLFVIVLICINISYMVPFMYVPDMAHVIFDHVTRTKLVWLPNAMSIANVVSRVPIGILADMRFISNITLMGVLCVVTGLSCLVMPFCDSYPLLVAVCVCYSASIVSAMVLIPVALSELFGDDVIANSFGLSLFFGGISGLIGTPLAGWLFDLTDTYEMTFIIAGVEFILGAGVLFLMNLFRTKL